MFVDRVVVTLEAGKGGNGCISFRREKYIPKGGPDGGDGGKGGNIILTSKEGIASLVDFSFHPRIKAENGGHGEGKKKTGRNGKDVQLYVPPGTVAKTYPDEQILVDFSEPGMSRIMAQGGKGGRGNTRFKSSTNQAPRRAERGEKGQSIMLVLELKLIAYAGLVGFPNAGKSTLLSRISNARPKIADYPFTTLTPHLGVTYQGYQSLVVADIPGIIEGAHHGEGMGLEFLRHIERTRILVFLIDSSSYVQHTPLETLHILRFELGEYHSSLLKKRHLVVANKIDLLGDDRVRVDELARYCRKEKIPYLEISALKDIHLQGLKKKMFQLYNAA